MNLYKNKEIKNRLDRRLVDLFVKQNQVNDWLTVNECASWVFETNTPSTYHKRYTQNKLMSLVGGMGTATRARSSFEMLYKPETVGGFVYRLKDSFDAQQPVPSSLKEQINGVFSRERTHLSEESIAGSCLAELDF